MSSFTDPLVVEKKNNKWRVARELVYYVGEEGSDDKIVVPKGFVTDFASVPRLFWAFIPPDGSYTAAAVVHDYLYHTQERSRKESDLIFLEAMEVLGVVWWKRKVMYRSVRMFGWIPWKKKRT